MKTNIATTQSQSDRLLRCGVSADTADMSIRTITEPMIRDIAEWETPLLLTMPYSSAKDIYRGDYVEPAWSLSALLGLLPDIITYGGYQWGMFMTKLSKDCVCISYVRWDNFNSTIGHLSGDSIEACVKTIEWLTENNHKLNEQ